MFDLDDTLIAQGATDRDVCRLVCGVAEQRCNLQADILAEIVIGQAERLWQTSPVYDYCRSIGIGPSEGLHGLFPGETPELSRLRDWLSEYRLKVWSEALAAAGVRDSALASEMAALFAVERNARSDVYADAEPTLRLLKREYRLGLLTNGDSALQRRKLQSSDLGRYFRATVISGDIGIGKPDPAVFELIASELGVQTAEAVMVGDNLVRDVAGAIGAGMSAVWLNRDGSPAAGEGFAEIHSLDELPALLASIR